MPSKSKISASDEAAGAAVQSDEPVAVAVYLLAPIDSQAPPFYMAHVPALMVVAAASPEQARTIANAAAGPVGAECWLDEGLSSCDLLEPTEPGVIAQDFITAPPPRAPEVPVTEPPVNVDVPYLGGSGAVGELLSCTMGNWENQPTSYAYAWAGDGEPLAETGDSYLVVEADLGHSIACTVTATNAIGATEAPPSNAVTAFNPPTG